MFSVTDKGQFLGTIINLHLMSNCDLFNFLSSSEVLHQRVQLNNLKIWEHKMYCK